MSRCKHAHVVLTFLVLVFLTLFPVLEARAQWEIQTLDSPKYFEYFGPRSIALDNQGRPHMAYGGDRLYHAYFDGTAWREETVDSSPGSGWAASIAIGSNNAVHICYANTNQYKMMYATNASGSWTTVELAVGPSVSSTIVVDAQNHVHMCWADSSELHYATNASGPFQVETLKSGHLSWPSSLTTDSQGKIHIGYTQALNENGGWIWTVQHLTNSTGAWISERVDEGVENFGGCVVAVDSHDKVHIGYVYRSWSLRHATNGSGAWVHEEVLTGADNQISMDLDSSDHVHLSYRTSMQGSSGLRRATNASGSWTSELVDGGSGPFTSWGSTGAYSSIVVDAQDHLHISYFDNWLEGLRYATNASGAWVSITVDTAGAPGQYCSIAVDPSDRVHISYNDSIWNFGKLKYAVSDTFGVWSLQEADNNGRVGQYSSIAADSAGHAHIAYGDNASGTTKYATNETASWAQETVGSSSQGQYISLALDSSGVAHMAYIDYVTSGSRVAYTTNLLGTWTTEAVETSASYGLYYTSIAVDSQDQVHLVYYDYTAKTLKHATKISGVWVIESIASGVNLTSPTSVAVDASDRLHVCYYIYSSDPPGVFDFVMHATNASGSWASEDVGFSGTVNAHGSIAVDHSGNIHISFNTGGNGTGLTYASNATGAWVLENVDASFSEVGVYHSLAVDSQNRVHIAYYDAILRDLKYARKTSGAIAHTLTINKSGSGSGGVTSTDGHIDCGPGCASDTADYLPGSEVRLTASAAPGSAFRGWNGGGCSGYGECVVTMTADTTVTATFAELFTLFVNKGGNGAGRVVSGDGNMDCGSGCLSASADYLLGDQVRLTATADPGSSFTGWTGGGCSGTGECVVNISGDTNVTASFSVPNLPDLTGSFSNITRRTTRFFGRSRHLIRGQLNASNVGAADCNRSFWVRVYQSLDGIYSADDRLLGYLHFSTIPRGGARSRTFTYRIVSQANVSGTSLIAVMDATNWVAEGNEANNIVLGIIP